jgi:hypothetical protein
VGEKEISEIESRDGTIESRDGEVGLEERVCEECGVVEDEYHFIVECERGRLAREVLLVEVGEKVAGKDKLLQWVLGGFVKDGIEWGVVVGRFLRRVWESRGGLEKPRRGKN